MIFKNHDLKMKWILLIISVLLIFHSNSPGISAQEQIDVDAYPQITYFPDNELVILGDNQRRGLLRIKCKATGKQPLNYKWRLSNKNSAFSYKDFITGDNSELVVHIPLLKDPYQVFCIASNKYGTVISDVRQVVIAAISPFKSGPLTRISKIYYSYGHPLVVPCPPHEVHNTATYSWGTYDQYNGVFHPLKESKHHGITSKGSLVFNFVKQIDVDKVLHCRASVGSTHYIAHGYGFSSARSKTQSGSVFNVPAALVERPQAYEMARRGSTKTMRCIPKGNPDPNIVWYKDGHLIVSGKNNMKLESFNRVLVIINVNKKTHAGKYQCGNRGSSYRELASTNLYVTGSPVITKRSKDALTIDNKQKFTLECRAKQMFSAVQDPLHYIWYKNFKRIENSSNKTVVRRNSLTVMNIQSEDSGVYQCVAFDKQGNVTTSTRVLVKEKMCPAIPPPLYSKFTERLCHMHSFFKVGTRCTVLCDRGFFGKGRRNHLKCLDDGGWSVMQYLCQDDVPPKLRHGYGCPSTIVIATGINNDTGAQVTWKPPVAEDNSGKLVTKIEPQGIKGNSHWFPVGDNVVKYMFIDPSGQNVSCQFIATVFTRTKIVTKPPSLIYILNGKTLHLPCIAKSYPVKPLYTWKKSSFKNINKVTTIKSDSHIQLLLGGERLVMKNVTDEDTGKYVCEAVNTYYNVPGIRDTAVLSVEVIREVQWSPWQHWAKCDVKKCGKGLRARKRACYKKDTLRSAIGCEGPETQSKPCHVTCPTITPPPVITPFTIPNDNKILGNSHIIKHVAGNYEDKARGWIKQRSPWLYSWLDTTGGRVGFALSLGLLGTVIVLISWYCGRFFFGRKKKVHFADEQQDANKGNDDKVNEEESSKKSSPIYENLPLNQEPEYENTKTTPIYENTMPIYENTTPIYENTMPIHENTPILVGHNEPSYENTSAIQGHYDDNTVAITGQYENAYHHDGQFVGVDGYYYGNDHYGDNLYGDDDVIEEDMVTE